MKIKKYIVSALIALTTSFSTLHAAEIATGSQGGGYESHGHQLVNQLEKQGITGVEVLNTNGSLENLELFDNKESVIMAMVQMDALNIKKPVQPFKARSAYSESVMWVYNKKHDFKDLSKLEKNTEYQIVLVEGGGSEITMRNFANEDKGYTVNMKNAIFVEDNYEAAAIVAEGSHNGKKVAGMIYVGKRIPSEIVSDFSGVISVGSATDGDFSSAKDVNGEPLYTNCEVTDLNLNGMPRTGGFFGKDTLDTVCVQSAVIYKTKGMDKSTERAVMKAVIKANKLAK